MGRGELRRLAKAPVPFIKAVRKQPEGPVHHFQPRFCLYIRLFLFL